MDFSQFLVVDMPGKHASDTTLNRFLVAIQREKHQSESSHFRQRSVEHDRQVRDLGRVLDEHDEQTRPHQVDPNRLLGLLEERTLPVLQVVLDSALERRSVADHRLDTVLEVEEGDLAIGETVDERVEDVVE